MLTVHPHKLPLERGSRLLDLGCGQGRHVHALARDSRLSLIGLDLHFESAESSLQGLKTFFPAAETSRAGWLVLQGDCLELPFADSSFEGVVCSEVLEHIRDYGRVISEINRILVPRGILALSVPRFWPEWICWALSREYSREPGGHLRIFKTGRLKSEIEKAGFACFSRHWAHGLHAPYWWLKCFRWRRRETWWPIRLYHRFLVWDMLESPFLTRWLERCLNPLCGKSLVLYFRKVMSC